MTVQKAFQDDIFKRVNALSKSWLSSDERITDVIRSTVEVSGSSKRSFEALSLSLLCRALVRSRYRRNSLNAISVFVMLFDFLSPTKLSLILAKLSLMLAKSRQRINICQTAAKWQNILLTLKCKNI